MQVLKKPLLVGAPSYKCWVRKGNSRGAYVADTVDGCGIDVGSRRAPRGDHQDASGVSLLSRVCFAG